MGHQARTAAKTDKSDNRQKMEEDLALRVTAFWDDPKNTTVVRQIVLKAMCKTIMSVFQKASGLIEVFPHETVARHHP